MVSLSSDRGCRSSDTRLSDSLIITASAQLGNAVCQTRQLAGFGLSGESLHLAPPVSTVALSQVHCRNVCTVSAAVFNHATDGGSMGIGAVGLLFKIIQ